jgi:hypothetical protein
MLPRFSLHCLPTRLNSYTQQHHNLYRNPIRLGEREDLAVHTGPTEKCCPQPSRQPPPRIIPHLLHQPSCLAATRCLVPQLIYLRLHHLTSEMTSNVLSAPSKATATQMSSSSFAKPAYVTASSGPLQCIKSSAHAGSWTYCMTRFATSSSGSYARFTSTIESLFWKTVSNVHGLPRDAFSDVIRVLGAVALIIDFAVVGPDGAMYLQYPSIPHCLLEGGREPTLEDVKLLIPTRRRSL